MASRGYDPAPLLPDSVKVWLQGWLCRVLGFAVLVCCAATGASLVSWTAIDPILARATGSTARNLMGAPGAIVSDVMMQMTGLAGTFLLLPPLFWALNLLSTGRPPAAMRLKVALAPLAVLCMAVALSSLPMLRSSPLHHGYGGLLGDTVLIFIAGLLAKVNPERAWAAAGLFSLACGTLVLMRSIGLTQQDLRALVQTAPRLPLPQGRWRTIAKRQRREPVFAAPPPRVEEPVRREPTFDTPPPRANEPAPMPPPQYAPPPRSPHRDDVDSGRGFTFDDFTDQSSEDIARRFAPGGAAAVGPRLSPVAVDASPAPELMPEAPRVPQVEATWVRSSSGPLKRRPPARGIAPPSKTSSAGASLGDLLACDAFRASDATLPIALGRSHSSEPIIADLARMPNLLLAAAAHAEKSDAVSAVILSLASRHAPDQCRLLLIAPDRPDLAVFEGLPHCLGPIVIDAHNGVAALEWVASEMNKRFERMACLGVGNIDIFNNRVRRERGPDAADLGQLPHIVVVVDEIAPLMRIGRHRLESVLARLDKKARAAGIHLVMATVHPTKDVVTAAIKKVFPTRIVFRLACAADSSTVIDAPGAEQLSGEGHMLYWSGPERVLRGQGPSVSNEELSVILTGLRDRAASRYV
jgi:DNA segregation ATPase FtsK/SpoIIIE, S-DNA-T family